MDATIQKWLSEIQGILWMMNPYLIGLAIIALFYRILR